MFHRGFNIALDIRSFNLYAHMGHGSWIWHFMFEKLLTGKGQRHGGDKILYPSNEIGTTNLQNEDLLGGVFHNDNIKQC
jgi:hypothetical protein